MAAIDKTYYKSKSQYDKALAWANEHWLKDIVYDYKEWKWERVLWNTSEQLDKYIHKYCPIDFIQDRLKEQYGPLGTRGGKVLVERIDDGDSSAQPTRTIINIDIHCINFVDILKEISWEYFNQIYDEPYGFIRDTIKILSITNLSF